MNSLVKTVGTSFVVAALASQVPPVRNYIVSHLDDAVYSVFEQYADRYSMQKASELADVINTAQEITIPHQTEYTEEGKTEPSESLKRRAQGFVVGNLYLTAYHVIEPPKEELLAVAFGGIQASKPINVTHSKTTIDGIDIGEPWYVNKETDVAVFKLPDRLLNKYSNNVEVSNDVYVGMPVIWSGNPGMKREVVRTGKIGSLGNPEDEKTRAAEAYALNTYIVRGSSGTPVFSHGGKIIGTIEFVRSGVGYVRPISNYPITIEQKGKLMDAQLMASMGGR